MAYEFYHQSIDAATLTYSAMAIANYPETNLQDRNINTQFKDAPAANVTLKIDFGSTRACNFLILGKFLATGDDITTYDLHYGTADNGADFENASLANKVLTSSAVTYYETITSQTKRYWRLTFKDVATLNTIQGATIFLGTKITLSHSPEPNEVESADYLVNTNQSEGGIRFGNISNTTVRRIWDYNWSLLSEADKTKLETLRDSIYMNEDLSRYPFYWSPNTGTTIYFARTNGKLALSQEAFEAWQGSFTFEEEL